MLDTYCRNCGKKLNEEAAFCPDCGTKVKKSNVNNNVNPKLSDKANHQKSSILGNIGIIAVIACISVIFVSSFAFGSIFSSDSAYGNQNAQASSVTANSNQNAQANSASSSNQASADDQNQALKDQAKRYSTAADAYKFLGDQDVNNQYYMDEISDAKAESGAYSPTPDTDTVTAGDTSYDTPVEDY